MPWKRPAAWVERWPSSFSGFDELLEEVEEEGVGFAQAGHRVGVDQGVEDDRALAALDGGVADLHGAVAGLVGESTKGRRWGGSGYPETGPEAVAKGLGGDAGAVGNEENGAGLGHGSANGKTILARGAGRCCILSHSGPEGRPQRASGGRGGFHALG
jgi:hypothetical protein